MYHFANLNMAKDFAEKHHLRLFRCITDNEHPYAVPDVYEESECVQDRDFKEIGLPKGVSHHDPKFDHETHH